MTTEEWRNTIRLGDMIFNEDNGIEDYPTLDITTADEKVTTKALGAISHKHILFAALPLRSKECVEEIRAVPATNASAKYIRKSLKKAGRVLIVEDAKKKLNYCDRIYINTVVVYDEKRFFEVYGERYQRTTPMFIVAESCLGKMTEVITGEVEDRLKLCSKVM